MAITATYARLFRSLPLPLRGTMLEIGQANWYGDTAPDFPCRDAGDLWQVARDFYDHAFFPSQVVAVDLGGSETAIRADLNYKIPVTSSLKGSFNVVVNNGTAEHIFNIAQVFKTMHDFCDVGGLMVHDAPFTGWLDHGFYNIQPTLFYDLAKSNEYQEICVAIHEIYSGWTKNIFSRGEMLELLRNDTATGGYSIPRNSMLFVALRKQNGMPFRVPIQGYYNNTISPEAKEAWRTMR